MFHKTVLKTCITFYFKSLISGGIISFHKLPGVKESKALKSFARQKTQVSTSKDD